MKMRTSIIGALYLDELQGLLKMTNWSTCLQIPWLWHTPLNLVDRCQSQGRACTCRRVVEGDRRWFFL